MKTLACLTLAAALYLPACRSAPPPDPGIELRLYDVPKGTASSLATTIGDIMWMGDNKQMVGRAVVTPDGRLAVLATPAVHLGVQELVEQVTKHPPKLEQSVELLYYVIVAKPASSAQPAPPGSELVKPALDEIVRATGPQTFTIAQRARLTSLHDAEGRFDDTDAKLELRQVPVQTNEGVFAKIMFRFGSDKVETKVQLAPDRIVVLGSTGTKTGADLAGATIYYVVRVAPRPDGQRP